MRSRHVLHRRLVQDVLQVERRLPGEPKVLQQGLCALEPMLQRRRVQRDDVLSRRGLLAVLQIERGLPCGTVLQRRDQAMRYQQLLMRDQRGLHARAMLQSDDRNLL